MVNRSHILLLLCVGLTLPGAVSCTREMRDSEEDTFILSAFIAKYPVIELDEDTKSEAGGVIYNTYWNVGDEMALVNVTQGYRVDKYISQSRIINTQGAGQFVAEGTVTYNSNDIVYAVYPYAAISLVDDGSVKRLANNKLTITLTDNLSYTSKSNSPMFSRNDIQVSSLIRASSMRANGSADGYPGITMNRLTGMLRVLSHVSDEDLASIRINSVTLNASGIAGSQDVTFSGSNVGATPSFSSRGGGSLNSLTVNLTNRPTVASTATIAEFIPFFPIWMGRDDTHDGFSLVYNTDDYQLGFHREANGYWRSNAVIALNIFEGSYTRVANRSLAVGDLLWWGIRTDDNPFNGEITPGMYQEGNMPGSGTGAYEDRVF